MADSSPVRRTPEGRRRAKKVIDFIERLTIPNGTNQGKLFKLDAFQKAFIRDIYEPHIIVGNRYQRRVVRRAILSMARKNGKTALIAAIVLAHLVGPEAILHGEIYSAANDRDQAAIVFKFARQIVDLEPELQATLDVVPSTKTMVARPTGSVYRAVSAEAGTKHGYLPSLVIYDELAQAKNRDLYDVLDTSFGARQEPLFIAISTQSNDPEHVLSKLIDDGLSGVDPAIVCHLYAAKHDCDLDDEEEWKKANPALDKFPRPRGPGDRDPQGDPHAGRGAQGPQPVFEPARGAYRRADLARRNGWRCQGDVAIEPGEEVYLALDLSSVVDLDRADGRLGERPVPRAAVFLEAARSSHRARQPRLRLGLASLPRMGRARAPEDQPRQEHRPRGHRAVHRRAAAALPGQGPGL